MRLKPLRNWLQPILYPRPGLGRDVMILLGGNAAGQVITVAAAPILTRLYDPVQYGVFTTFFSLAVIVISVSALRLEFAIPITRSRRMALATTKAALSAVAGVSLLLALVWVILRILRVDPAHAWPTWSFVWLLPLVGLAGGTANVLSYYAIRQKAFGVISTTRITQSGGTAVAQIGLSMLSRTATGLILGDAAGRWAAAVWSWGFFRRDLASYPGRVGMREMRGALSRFAQFPRISAPATLLNSICIMGPPIAFSLVYDARTAGLVGVSQRLVGMPIVLIGTAVAQAFLAHFAAATRDGETRLERLYLGAAGRLALVGVLPLTLIFLLAPWGVPWALGKQWVDAGPVVQILVPSLFLQIVVSPLSTVLSTLERMDLQLTWDAARLIGLVVLFAWAKAAQPRLTVVLIAFSGFMAATYAANFFVTWRAIRMHARSKLPGVASGLA